MPGLEHRETIHIRYSDLDMLGHMNQAVYHEVLEDARGGLLAEVVEPGTHAYFVLVKVELSYHAEVTKECGTIDVIARVADVGTKSVTLEQEVVKPDGVVAASGTMTIVAWDPEQRTSREISEKEKRALTRASDA